MMINEFSALTGIYPDAALYAQIEQAYYNFDGDKQAFCKAYAANKDGIAERIARQANNAAAAVEFSDSEATDRLQDEIDRLTRQLRKAQERNGELADELAKAQKIIGDSWKPWTDKDAIRQADYDHMKQGASWYRDNPTRHDIDWYGFLTDDKAQEIIADEFGFNPERVKILHETTTFEINYYGQMRRTGTAERLPMYVSTDWNYIRFIANGITYEMHDGGLRRVSED